MLITVWSYVTQDLISNADIVLVLNDEISLDLIASALRKQTAHDHALKNLKQVLDKLKTKLSK